MQNQHQIVSVSRRLLMAVIATCSLIICCFSCVPNAYADQLTVEKRVPYAGYSTHRFLSDGYLAYCAQPEKQTPKPGNYAAIAIEDRYTLTNAEETYAILYYSYGGPGFDPSMWPNTWFDGSRMNNDKYFAITHVVIADRLMFSAPAALYSCDKAFCTWWAYNFSPHWTTYFEGTYRPNEDCFYNRAYAAWQNLDERTRNAFKRSVYILATGSNTQDIFVYGPIDGAFELQKASAYPEMTNYNPFYTLEGAVYGYFTDEACSEELGRVTTDSDGYAKSDDLPSGTYFVRELVAPEGYALDSTVYSVTVPAGKTASLNGGKVYDTPIAAPIRCWGIKIDDANPGGAAQGDASLAEARYTVRFYADYFDSAEAAIAHGTPLRTWMVETSSDGSLLADDASKYFGDDYFTIDDIVVAPFGTVIIQEERASEGYLMNVNHIMVRIVPNQTDNTEPLAQYETVPLLGETIVRGGVRIEKRDLETGLTTPLGAARLDGTEFSIYNSSNRSVVVAGSSFEPGDLITTIETEDGTAELPNDTLPYGTYRITETQASEGYLLTTFDTTFAIRTNEETVCFLGDNAAYNQVKRGDLAFVKTDERTQRRLAGVPFVLTSLTTGESHVLISDDNGFVSTAANFNKHTHHTNGNDWLLDDASDKSGSLATSSECGIWFGLARDMSTAPVNDELPALPYDTYLLEELPCEANKNNELVSLPITISREYFVVDFGTIDNQSRQPEPDSPTQPQPDPNEKTNTPSNPEKLAETKDAIAMTIVPLVTLSGAALGALSIASHMRQKTMRRERYFERHSPLR